MSQPLQIRGGDLTLSLPTSFNQQTEQAEFTNVSTGFANEGRPLDIEAGYTFRGLKNMTIQFNGAHSVSGFGRGQTAVQVRLASTF